MLGGGESPASPQPPWAGPTPPPASSEAAAVREALQALRCRPETSAGLAGAAKARCESRLAAEGREGPRVDGLSVEKRAFFEAEAIARARRAETSSELAGTLIGTPTSDQLGAGGARGGSSSAHVGCVVRADGMRCGLY